MLVYFDKILANDLVLEDGAGVTTFIIGIVHIPGVALEANGEGVTPNHPGPRPC